MVPEQEIRRWEDWMAEARIIAESALPMDVPVGALLLQHEANKHYKANKDRQSQWQCIAQGFNTRERDNNPCGHAEINALITASQKLGRWRLNDCSLIVTLEPCPMCMGAILQARIQVLVFGAFDPIAGACGSAYQLAPEPSQMKILGGVSEEACRDQLHAFFQLKRIGQ
ncbi:MAG: nucleoside deaminase [Cyanobacteria bacterium]|nr:nucleoside deaminase [Cyanobacteriota bacterium]